MRVRLTLFGAAWLTYLVDREDVVWRSIKGAGQHTRALEHTAFAVASVLVGDASHLRGSTSVQGHANRNASLVGFAYTTNL